MMMGWKGFYIMVHLFPTYLELAEFVEQRLMREVADVLNMIICLIFARDLLLRVPRVDALEDA